MKYLIADGPFGLESYYSAELARSLGVPAAWTRSRIAATAFATEAEAQDLIDKRLLLLAPGCSIRAYAPTIAPAQVSEYHAALGVEAGATRGEIEAAFRKLAMKHHPDRDPNGAERFIEVRRAYEILTGEREAP